MLFLRSLEIEDDKNGNRQMVYSLKSIEAKKGLSKAMAFVTGKEGSSKSVLEWLDKDIKALEKRL